MLTENREKSMCKAQKMNFVSKVLVFERHVAEQVRHRLLVVDATNGFRKQNAYVDCLDFMALHLLDLVWDRIGDDHFVDGRVFNETWRVGR